MKHFNILVLLLLTSFSSCSYSPESILNNSVLSAQDKLKLKTFENNYVSKNSMNSRDKNTKGIYLFGYKWVQYFGENKELVNKIWEEHKIEIEENGSFLTLDGLARIYCPLKDAILTINDVKYYADSCGYVNNLELLPTDEIHIIGRSATEKSILTIFNSKLSPNRIIGNCLIFNLGEKDISHSKHETNLLSRSEGNSGDNDGGVSCTVNHGNYPNCTYAFDCYRGRCDKRKDICIDYNGPGTNCTHDHKYFIGSDCAYAMAMGHCWNELMR